MFCSCKVGGNHSGVLASCDGMWSISGLRSWVWSPGTRGRGHVSGLRPHGSIFLSVELKAADSHVSLQTPHLSSSCWKSLGTVACPLMGVSLRDSTVGCSPWQGGVCLQQPRLRFGLFYQSYYWISLYGIFLLIIVDFVRVILILIYTDRMYFINKSHILCRM